MTVRSSVEATDSKVARQQMGGHVAE